MRKGIVRLDRENLGLELACVVIMIWVWLRFWHGFRHAKLRKQAPTFQRGRSWIDEG